MCMWVCAFSKSIRLSHTSHRRERERPEKGWMDGWIDRSMGKNAKQKNYFSSSAKNAGKAKNDFLTLTITFFPPKTSLVASSLSLGGAANRLSSRNKPKDAVVAKVPIPVWPRLLYFFPEDRWRRWWEKVFSSRKKKVSFDGKASSLPNCFPDLSSISVKVVNWRKKYLAEFVKLLCLLSGAWCEQWAY